ncbi:REP-associated tyrosine transposase [Fimbriimonas ginsengisoli]|uniref:Transposase IS200-like domain-containing protein n=1 Tax=Fimbriimonas ginsengisoli Gsoil 348 TaxID=661478 RepID=A0A068NKS9_FIMGI|nr:transposase [Fimbriimonas ginsengisoli]AIE83400.1 hypothetical protein OP10G_0032 [Fimbriimonas ginsengisoli Gsoil 348]
MNLSETPQFITWRLADALPVDLLHRWEAELENNPPDQIKRELWRRIENFIDAGHGSEILRHPMAARAVQESLAFNHNRKYRLHNWVVMPNHVHVLLTPIGGHQLGNIVGPIKSFTSKEIHRLLGGSGPLWQVDYFDRWIRDEKHLGRVASYIEWNPVKAKLCQDPVLWPWSSANEAAHSRLEGR